ncbi:MAG TPA: ribosome silencing factor [Candidatus Ozemobacteraceae bacterium]|nr:ribosome silencing factor [Candidatus Ozemobacteraceae bacterium]
MTETTKKTTRTTSAAKAVKSAGAKSITGAKKTPGVKKAAGVKKTAGATGAAGAVKRSRTAAAAKSASTVKPPRRKVEPKARSEERVAPRKASKQALPELVEKVVKTLSDRKVVDLALLDVEGLVSYADYFILGTGNNTPHVQSMADAVAMLLKVPGVKGALVEGDSQSTWVLIDGGYFVVHLFQPDARRFYALDDLWSDAARIPVES